MSPVKTKFSTSLLKTPFFLSNGAIRLKENVELENVVYVNLEVQVALDLR